MRRNPSDTIHRVQILFTALAPTCDPVIQNLKASTMKTTSVKMSAPFTLDARPARSETRFPAAKLTGLVIVALLPALFWTAILAAVSNAIGFALSTAAMFVTASAIALFLTVIYAAISAGSDQA